MVTERENKNKTERANTTQLSVQTIDLETLGAGIPA